MNKQYDTMFMVPARAFEQIHPDIRNKLLAVNQLNLNRAHHINVCQDNHGGNSKISIKKGDDKRKKDDKELLNQPSVMKNNDQSVIQPQTVIQPQSVIQPSHSITPSVKSIPINVGNSMSHLTGAKVGTAQLNNTIPQQISSIPTASEGNKCL